MVKTIATIGKAAHSKAKPSSVTLSGVAIGVWSSLPVGGWPRLTRRIPSAPRGRHLDLHPLKIPYISLCDLPWIVKTQTPGRCRPGEIKTASYQSFSAFGKGKSERAGCGPLSAACRGTAPTGLNSASRQTLARPRKRWFSAVDENLPGPIAFSSVFRVDRHWIFPSLTFLS